VFDSNFRVVKVHRIGTNASYYFNEKNSIAGFFDVQFTETDDADNVVTGQKNDERLMETGLRYSYRLTRYLSFDIGYTFGRRFTTQNNLGRNEYTFNNVSGGVNLAF
jgi:hypothetical protein